MRPLSLPQLNTVCQYLGHQRLMVEIRHTDVRARKHTLFKHRKVLTPNSNLKLQAITRLSNKKPKWRKEVTQWGFARHGGGGDGALTDWLRQQNAFRDGVFANYTRQTKTAIHQIPPAVKRDFSGLIFFKKTPLTPITHFNSSVAASTAAHTRQMGVNPAIRYSIYQRGALI